MLNKTKDIEVRWARRLQKEHGDICYQQRVTLPTPVVAIVAGKRRLGYWTPANQTISISKNLIEKNPWEIVLEIFKHEMAHQFVSIYFDDADTHGKGFKTACDILGVHPAFAGTGNPREVHLAAFKDPCPKRHKPFCGGWKNCWHWDSQAMSQKPGPHPEKPVIC